MKHNTKGRSSARAGTSRYTGSPQKLHKVAKKREYDCIDMRLELSDILDAFPFYVMLVDENHHILQANSAVRTKLGVAPEDIVGKYCPSVIHGLDRPIDACPLEEALKINQAVEREIFDAVSQRWIKSAIYPTGSSTADGKRIFFHMVTDISDRKEAEEQLETSREQLRDLSQHLESVREEERTNSAREIHDELGQLLTALKIDISWVAKRLPKTEASLTEKTKTMYELIDRAIQTVKRISSELRPGLLDDLGLAAAIEWQAQELGKHTDIDFEFRASPKEITLDRDRSTAIFRICQEALTNVVRHANATKVKLSLQEKRGRILLRISDNGKGIKEKQLSDPKAFGLIGMRERARFWRGEIKISGTPGKGTTVAVSIPL
jgi:PAS domain S-box-containing protein